MKKTTKPEDMFSDPEVLASTPFFDRLKAASAEVGEAQDEYLEFAKGNREWGDDILEMKDDAMNSMMTVLGEIFPGLDGEDHPLRETGEEESND